MTDIEKKTSRLVLASASPRRAELMRQAGYACEVQPPPLREPDEMGPDVPPAAQAEALSYFKARSVANSVGDGLIVAADTVVALGPEVFGKPADVGDARRMLRKLSGTRHHVITGVTLLDARSRRRSISHDTTTVTMRAVPGESLERYLAGRAWVGKAGAYGIQDRSDAFIERIDGSFTNVVGLPMELLADLLARWGYGDVSQRSAEPESV